ncbi:MAG: hypothetical protein P8104_09700 [Gammaproteobacteria bacterium]
MQFKPISSTQIVVIWKLMLAGKPVRLNEMHPELTPVKKFRKPMEDAGLIEMIKIDKKLYYKLNDEIAWDWAATNLNLEPYLHLLKRSQSTGDLFCFVLKKLEQYIDNSDATLADVLYPERLPERAPEQTSEHASEPFPQRPSYDNIVSTPSSHDEIDFKYVKYVKDKITHTYQKLSSGQKNSRIRLSALKAELPEISVKTLDECIKWMQQEDSLVLFSIQDFSELTPADEAAAIFVGTGKPRHIVMMG